MNEELEYAEMLEIPVSTVNVVKKKSMHKRKKKEEDLKEKAISAVNERSGSQTYLQEIPAFNLEEEASLDIPAKRTKWDKFLLAETVAACLLAFGIFATNFILPNSAINTFIGSIGEAQAVEATYSDFHLAPVVSELSSAEVSVSSMGVISFTDDCAVYPVCNGTVTAIRQEAGVYTMEISHSSRFCSIITGVDTVYYGVGDVVKGRVPVARSNGQSQVRISLFNEGELLNCYSLSGALPVWNS